MGNRQQKYDAVEDIAAQDQGGEDAHDMETQRIGSSRRLRDECTNHESVPFFTSIRSDYAIAASTDTESKRPVPDSIQLDKVGASSVRAALDPLHHERRSRSSSLSSIRNAEDLHSLAETVFSDIRSESTATRLSICNDADKYQLCTAFQRAFPERSFALIVTLIFELPTLFLIEGGSDRLCKLIGRRRYTVLIALLPLISAIAGNVGLQASTLTTRAISHGQVRVDNYRSWLRKEIMAAAYLGFAIGAVIASISFRMGGRSYPFALSIFTAQFMGILTAGITGTLAPLLFTFIFKRDSGKWGGPLETAVQDVIGSFAMIVVTYRIMHAFGPFDLDPSDIC